MRKVEELNSAMVNMQNQNILLKAQMTAKDNIVNKIKKENEEMHKKAGKAELPAEELAVQDEF